jgi:hypothetical protein
LFGILTHLSLLLLNIGSLKCFLLISKNLVPWMIVIWYTIWSIVNKLKSVFKNCTNPIKTLQDEIIMQVWPGEFTSNDKIFAIAICYFILGKDYNGMNCKSQYIIKIMKQLEVIYLTSKLFTINLLLLISNSFIGVFIK